MLSEMCTKLNIEKSESDSYLRVICLLEIGTVGFAELRRDESVLYDLGDRASQSCSHHLKGMYIPSGVRESSFQLLTTSSHDKSSRILYKVGTFGLCDPSMYPLCL